MVQKNRDLAVAIDEGLVNVMKMVEREGFKGAVDVTAELVRLRGRVWLLNAEREAFARALRERDVDLDDVPMEEPGPPIIL